uniref:Potassium channel domain-containing protein n=1 Tax=Meloidogyne javanica TaxID=6303 RepID=A0A915N671_MELJA
MGDTDSFKDLQNLLDNVEKLNSWRKYARLVLPHVGLVLVVCIYAMIEQRKWIEERKLFLRKFGEQLFHVYKEQYVRYEDVRPALTLIQQQQQLSSTITPHLDPRFRRHFSKSRSEGKMWTPSSALFFAATTMATIGYGNIVPMTNQGRIACIIFALFGAPLAIITIGDLGKFLSECTIWLYRHSKDKYRFYRYRISQSLMAHRSNQRRRLKEDFISGELAGDLEMGNNNNADDLNSWDENHKTESEKRMNDWEYIVIMLLYLGIGLAVTTMIHYFGRKFQGTDILQILRRKRMLERRFAMGEGKEFIEFVIKHEREALNPLQQRAIFVQPSHHIVSHLHEMDQPEDGKLSLQSEKEAAWLEQDTQQESELVLATELMPKVFEPEPLPKRMYSRLNNDRLNSWAESGPTPSIKSSLLSTEPSVEHRQQTYQNFISPQPSLNSFAFNFPIPSPDLRQIAETARTRRRLVSCPSFPSYPVELSLVRGNLKWRKWRTIACPSLAFAPKAQLPRFVGQPVWYYRRRRSLQQFEAKQHQKQLLEQQQTNPDSPTQKTKIIPQPENYQPILRRKKRERLAKRYDPLIRFDWLALSPRIAVTEEGIPATMEQITERAQELTEMQYLPKQLATEHPVYQHIAELEHQTTESTTKKASELVHIPFVLDLPPSPPPPEPEPPSMKTEVLPTINKADESIVEDPKPNVEEALPPIARAVVMHEQVGEQTKDSSTEAQVAQRLLPSFTPDMLGITKSEMTRLSPEQFVNEQQHLLLPETVQASVDENAPEETTFSSADEWDRLMNLASTEQLPNIVSYVRQMISDVPQIPSLERLSISEEDELIFFADTEAEEEEPAFEIDLGAFELVDAGISAEELLANEDPVIYHRDMPVHSVHHDTVQTEAAIQNLMNASQSMLSSQIPPTMVADNYCFAVDADKIQMDDVLGDEHWWKHTSRPTKYFYSEDLRHFYRVNLLTSRGKIISARLANTTPAMGGPGSVAEMLPPEMSQQQRGDFGQTSSFSMPNTARRSLTFCTGSAGRPSFAIPSLDP